MNVHVSDEIATLWKRFIIQCVAMWPRWLSLAAWASPPHSWHNWPFGVDVPLNNQSVFFFSTILHTVSTQFEWFVILRGSCVEMVTRFVSQPFWNSFHSLICRLSWTTVLIFFLPVVLQGCNFVNSAFSIQSLYFTLSKMSRKLPNTMHVFNLNVSFQSCIVYFNYLSITNRF